MQHLQNKSIIVGILSIFIAWQKKLFLNSAYTIIHSSAEQFLFVVQINV